jgi:hypothetical protein
MAQSVTITTSAATTGTLILNPVAKSTTVTLTSTTAAGTGSSASTVQIEMSLGDPSALGAPTLAWATLSSATAIPSSTALAVPLTYTVLSPIGAVRVNSTTASTGAAITFTLTALQSVTA